MFPLLRTELFHIIRRPMARVLLLILAALVVVLYVLLWSAVKQAPESIKASDIADLTRMIELNSVPSRGITLVQEIATLLAVVIGASAIATEFGWGTIRTILPRASSRGAFLSAKLLTLLAYVVVLVVVGFAFAVISSLFVAAIGNLSTAVSGDYTVRALEAMVKAVYVSLPYMAVAFAVALWARSSGAGIGVGLGLYFLDGIITSLVGLAGGPFKHVGDVLPQANVRAIMRTLDPTASTGAQSLPDPWQAAAVLAAYIVVCLAAAYWLFRRRDITVGSAG
jgi:ABC-2 type transport system permease protein